MKRDVISIFLVFLGLMPAAVSGAAPSCKSVEKLEVTSREFVVKGVGYQELKNGLIDAALKQAVEQAIGKQITTNTRSQTSLQNSQLKSTLKELNVERAKGYVKSYDLKPPGEELISMGDQTLMELTIQAAICIPKYRGVNYVVAIGEVYDANGEVFKHRAVKDTIIEEITKNPRFSAIRLPVSQETYYDYTLNIRIKGAQVGEAADGLAQIAAAFSKDKNKRSSKKKISQAKVRVALELRDVSDNSVKSFGARGYNNSQNLRPRKEEKAAMILAALDAAARSAAKRMMKKL